MVNVSINYIFLNIFLLLYNTAEITEIFVVMLFETNTLLSLFKDKSVDLIRFLNPHDIYFPFFQLENNQHVSVLRGWGNAMNKKNCITI